MKEGTVSLRLTPLSFIHIGSYEQQLRAGIEFIQDGGTCYVIDEKKLVYQLEKGKRLEEFVGKAGARGFNLRNFFNMDSLDLKKRAELLCAISSYSSSCPVGGQRYNQIRPFVRDAYAEPYVPGSALKGALRTALLYCFLKERKNNARFWEQQMNRVRAGLHAGGSREKKRKTLGEFLQEFLQDFDLHYEGRKIVPQPERQQTDLLRTVKIPDLPPVDKNSLEIREVRVVSLTTGNTCKFSHRREGLEKTETRDPLRIYPELLMRGELSLQIQIDIELWERFRSNDRWGSIKELVEKRADQGGSPPSAGGRAARLLAGLLSCCQEFADDIFIRESNLFAGLRPDSAEPDLNLTLLNQFYAEGGRKKPNLRMGWGSGMVGAGIFSLIEDKDIIEAVARLFPQYRRGGPPYGTRRDQDSIFDLFPKTRRVVMEKGTPALPLGWAKLEVL